MANLLVAVDTTEFFNSPYMDSVRWKQFWAYMQRTSATLVVPQVVVEEAKRHFRKKLETAVSQLGNAASLLNRALHRKEISTPDIHIEKVCSDYEKELLKLLRHAKVPKYADVSLEVVMKRCLDNRKPFDHKGRKGFRDAVIWEGVREVLNDTEEACVVLITTNTNDFGPHGGLARDLVEEVQGAVVVCYGMDKFGEEYAKPLFEKLDDAKAVLQEATVVEDLFSDVKYEVDVNNELRACSIPSIDSASLSDVDSLHFEVGDVYDTGNGVLTCSVSYKGEGFIEGVECEYEGPSEPPTPYGVQFPAAFRIEVEISFRLIDGEIDDVEFEITDVDLDVQL